MACGDISPAMAATKLHAEIMNWISGVYVCNLCTAVTWSDLNPYDLYSLQAASHWWLVCTCCDKQEVAVHAATSAVFVADTALWQ